MYSRSRLCVTSHDPSPLFTRLVLSVFFFMAPSLCIDPRRYSVPAELTYKYPDDDDDQRFQFETISELQEFEDFYPEELMRKLVTNAISNATQPQEFYNEIQELVRFHQTDFKYLDASNTPKRIRHLLGKYNIVAKSAVLSPGIITLQRLSLMFPHYNDFRKENNDYNPPHTEDIDKLFCIPRYNFVPRIMQHPEFGGLIPRQYDLPESVRESIIRVHLYSQVCDSEWDKHPNPISTLGLRFHEKMTLLEQRIEKSILSTERRIRLLKKSKILLEDLHINPAFLNILSMISI